MSPIPLACLLLMFSLAEVRQSFAANVMITNTTFTGLQGDFNIGHIGYVHLPSDLKTPELEVSSCQYFDVNQTTCNFVDKLPKSDANVMVLRSWTALTLRDNILSLLGYFSHQPNDVFSQDTNSALRLLYEEIRRNNIKSMDLLPRIKSMAKTSQVSQVLGLLKVLVNVVPSFCRSAVDELGKNFSKRRDVLKAILSAQKGVDLFADIGLQMVPLLRMKNIKRNYNKDVEASLGKEFAILFAMIQEGRIVLTQPVLAVFMHNMKFTELSPEEMEDFRFLCDVLRLNKIPDWLPGLSGSCCANIKDPYEMVQVIMKIMVERPKVDPEIKSIVGKLLPRLVKVMIPDLAAERMDRFFGKSDFNVSLFLEVLEDEIKISEVSVFRQMVGNGTINLSYALKGFIRYLYDTPRKLIVGLMKRIRHRVPMNVEAKNNVEAILLHLKGGEK